jgi:hypothetical protein
MWYPGRNSKIERDHLELSRDSLAHHAYGRLQAAKLLSLRHGTAGLNRDYLHLIYRGRLRLGMVRRIDHLLLANFLSLGIASWVQSRRLYWEMVWHLEGSSIVTRRIFAVLIPLPVLNAFSVFRFAALIREMERQNHYEELNMAKAMLLSLFPPFLIAYLQSLANKHWIAHATQQDQQL